MKALSIVISWIALAFFYLMFITSDLSEAFFQKAVITLLGVIFFALLRRERIKVID